MGTGYRGAGIVPDPGSRVPGPRGTGTGPFRAGCDNLSVRASRSAALPLSTVPQRVLRMSANPRNYPVSLLLAATVVVLGGCSDSPTEPDDTLSFSGAVLATASTSHAVTAADSEVWRIEAISLVQTLADGTVTNPSAIL